MEQESSLRRSIGFYALLFYGVGTMVGGGFYALLGKVAGEAGVYLPVALGVAGLIALVNSCAFSELSSRFPVSAGESRYVLEGFKLSWLSQLTGWMIVTTGVVSAATLAVAITGFLRDLVAVPETISLLITVALLGGIAAWGVAESVAVVVVITVIEVSALIFIIVVNSGNLIDRPTVWQATGDNSSPSTIMGIFTGAFLTFYAFIGFEDMVNMAEEVKEPERHLSLIHI